ncbi:hypothetical protein Gorai_012875 [Gossypium raimondii]|uniref:Uncharacterized protein n=1 Tax=Gossypium raimondii TaxID=29730 RepID=A0A7J8Q3B7_GOSRA|nr:hypothetical protein [Gossypium raimondii]
MEAKSFIMWHLGGQLQLGYTKTPYL